MNFPDEFQTKPTQIARMQVLKINEKEKDSKTKNPSLSAPNNPNPLIIK